MRAAVVVTAICLSLMGVAGAAEVAVAMRKPTEIPAQDLGAALQALAKERDFHVIFVAEDVGGVRTAGVSGEVTADEALVRILSGTGLTYRYIDEKTVTIVPLAKASNAASFNAEARSSMASGEELRTSMAPSDVRSFRVAQRDGSQSEEQSNPPDSAEDSQDAQLEEILVTAQKRIERLQDVPVPVTAISGDSLANNNLLRVEDYYARIPGMNLTVGLWGEPRVALRGIIMDPFDNPTVGITVDDLPYGSSASLAGNGGVPDIDPGDLARVEVLRGPQGALYGAGGMGGLIKFVTIDPSTDSFSGHAQAGISSVRNADEAGYNVRGSVNVPLSETWAIRASGFTRRDPGYIDNVLTGKRAVNSGDADGGRLSALWRPSDAFSLKLSALTQNTKRNGSSDVDVLPGLGDLQQNNLGGTGPYERGTDSYSATITAKLARLDLISISGYNVDTFIGTTDFAGFAYLNDVETTKITQEIRVSSTIGQRLDWLLGAFYTDEDNASEQDLFDVDPITGEILDTVLIGHFPNTFREHALFTGLTFHITDRLDVQIGGRQSWIRQTYSETINGNVTPEARTEPNAFTYLLTPQLKLSPDLMAYARFASGYRAGGPNSNVELFEDVPREFEPDETLNYELGIKGHIFNQALSFDASMYYIDWRDIQLKFVRDNRSFKGNGGRAKSQGVELSVEARPLAGLTLGAWVALNEAELSEDLPPESVAAGLFGLAGDRLPFSGRFSGNVSVDHEFPLGSELTGFVGGTMTYVDDRKGIFTATSERPVYKSYTQADVRLGARYDTWTVNLFVNNVADKRGVLLSDPNVDTSVIYIQPRIVGMSIVKTF